MVESLIVIGGPSRSGTNTIGAFLNLHEDVRGYSDANHIRLGPDLIAQLDKQGIRQPAMCLHHPEFEDYLSHKNNEDRSPRIVVLRLDYAETRPFELIRESLDMTVKLIYALRADLFAVFCSQAWRGMVGGDWGDQPITLDNLRHFIQRILESFGAIARLKSQYHDDVLIVDITNRSKAGQAYGDILGFAGLDANRHQESWMRLLPISNAGARSGNIVQEEYREWTEKHRYLDNELSILREHEIYRCMS